MNRNLAKRGIGFLIAALITVALYPAQAFGRSIEESIELANKIHMNLTRGVPLLPTHPRFNEIVSLVHADDQKGAAALITDPRNGSAEFYNVAIASIPQTFNRDGSPVGNRNELSALFLGYARDGLPFDEIFWKDWVYFDPTVTDANTNYAGRPDVHFQGIWRNKNPRNVLKGERRPGFPGVGIFTTDSWSRNYIDMGTNRRSFPGVLNNLYCVEHEAIQTLIVPDTYVSRDVPRAPAGSPEDYAKNCKSCHAQMDGFVRPAFSRYDTNAMGFLQYIPVKDKINETNFSSYAVRNDTWHLFVTNQQNADIFGFNDIPGRAFETYGNDLKYLSGQGLEEWGKLVGASSGVYRCMVKRIISQVYLRRDYSLKTMSAEDRARIDAQKNAIAEFAKIFQQDKNLRKIYELIAIHYANR